VIDTSTNPTSTVTSGKHLSGGVIAGLAVVGAIVAALLAVLLFGKVSQRRAIKGGPNMIQRGGIGVRWEEVGYIVPVNRTVFWSRNANLRDAEHGENKDGGKIILDSRGSDGIVRPGEMLAILGPSGEHLHWNCFEVTQITTQQVLVKRLWWKSSQGSARSGK
jgi:ATP-binding cassette, subfamily G (WHITE), member 2